MTEEQKLKLQLDKAIEELHRYDSIVTNLVNVIMTTNPMDINKSLERILNAGLDTPNRRLKTRVRNTKKK